MWGALISAFAGLGSQWMASGGMRDDQAGDDLRAIYSADIRARRANESMALRYGAQSGDFIPLAVFSVVILGVLLVVGKM